MRGSSCWPDREAVTGYLEGCAGSERDAASVLAECPDKQGPHFALPLLQADSQFLERIVLGVGNGKAHAPQYLDDVVADAFQPFGMGIEFVLIDPQGITRLGIFDLDERLVAVPEDFRDGIIGYVPVVVAVKDM